jgi:hypothetical protein
MRNLRLALSSAALVLLVSACASPTRAKFREIPREKLFAECWAQLERRFGAENVVADPAREEFEIASIEPALRVTIHAKDDGASAVELEVTAKDRHADSEAADLARLVLEDLELAILAAHPGATILDHQEAASRAD